MNVKTNNQRRTVTLDYHIEQEVTITKLLGTDGVTGISGVVLAMFIDGSGIQYKVRYFWEGEAKEVYFYPWEIEEA